MITDDLLQLSDAQVVTTTAVSENTIDLGANRDIGEGKQLFMHFAIPVAFAGGTSINFEVITSAAAALTSPTVIGASGVIVTADLTLGAAVAVPIPPQLRSLGERYLGARFTVVGTMSGGGAITTDIVDTLQDGESHYPAAYSV